MKLTAFRFWTFCLLWQTATASFARQLTNDLGIAQQDDATMKWYTDAKFGMFIHWGLYAVPAHGEWFMENHHMAPEEYRKFATDQGDGNYFDAKDFDPAAWAKIAKNSGIKYLCLLSLIHI